MNIKETDAVQTRYTFWPYNGEVEEIKAANPTELAEMAVEAKHVTQLYHELWRTNRTQDMADVTTEILKQGVAVTDELFAHAPARLASAEMLGAQRRDNARFLTDTWTVVVKTMTRTPLEYSLTNDINDQIAEVVNYSLETIDDLLVEKI